MLQLWSSKFVLLGQVEKNESTKVGSPLLFLHQLVLEPWGQPFQFSIAGLVGCGWRVVEFVDFVDRKRHFVVEFEVVVELGISFFGRRVAYR